tara:strand:+ start:148 stop:459 length:312 start_codon:yes stop_codon:yes gene_type:complete
MKIIPFHDNIQSDTRNNMYFPFVFSGGIFSNDSKVCPVVVESISLEVGNRVRIHNEDDDMHNQKGIFKGHFCDANGEYRSLIVLDENKKNFYTHPNTLQKCTI